MSKFYIWSIEHQGWWKPGKHGYTPNILEAGKYDSKESIEICVSANIGMIEEVMIPVKSIHPEYEEIKIKPQLPGPVYMKGDC